MTIYFYANTLSVYCDVKLFPLQNSLLIFFVERKQKSINAVFYSYNSLFTQFIKQYPKCI